MLSEKQLAADRANALRSTDPRTSEGKQKSSLNARRHNLTGQVTAMAPEGALELQFSQRIATDFWRLNRASAIEDNIFALGLDQHADNTIDHPEIQGAYAAARTFTAEAKSIELLTLYEQRINRTLHRNLALLQQLQAARKAAASEAAKKLSKMNDLPETPTRNGFVFSNATPDAKLRPDQAETTLTDQHTHAA